MIGRRGSGARRLAGAALVAGALLAGCGSAPRGAARSAGDAALAGRLAAGTLFLCDVNGDTKLNTADVTTLMDVLSGEATAPQNRTMWDANGDGKINTADVTLVMNWLSGAGSSPPTVDVSDGKKVSITVFPCARWCTAGVQTQFYARVTGTTDLAVTWSASGGTVSSSGLYTAPAAAGKYTVTATSHADAKQTATVNIEVSAGAEATISVQ